ncbi:B-block binding subunit of TFIIIC-domain-containing protein [Tricharina praecox]|uniref:B-block binding subunit of TFIIIC-domain-containing protein n=1 Tax=Tricharina praecox TaxID=43433 RepID=UPI002220FDA0|nr:B-block binding subunit of TFIIIC-domain-containing protein [Tricharina praecox]KAI5853861.1 B-block binding subunit of TFIIIC-domain-containing protein [Tricharina praecox]
MSVKALLNYVLEEVAIDGAEGTDVEELFKYVNDFYVKSRQERHYVGELLWADQLEGRKEDGDEDMAGDGDEAAAERDRIAAECWGTPNVKEEFQEYVWGLLRQQKDFNVGPKNESRGMSLGEIVDKWRENKDDANLRVYASEDRRWRTLTGHGPDPKRVPNAVFKCLEVIGKHREQGLIQPDLTKITGQDKKSIAGRTTLLKEMGYIEKVAVLAKSMNTSKLTLTKFAYLRDRKLAQDHKDDSGLKGKPASSKSSERWTGETIHLESLIRAIIAELKNAKNGVIQRGDLKKKLIPLAFSFPDSPKS